MDKIIFNLQLFAATGSGTSANPYVVDNLTDLQTVLNSASSSTYINISKEISVSASTSLDLKGATVTYTGGKANGIFSVSGSGALTLTNGTIKIGSNCTSTNNGPTALTYLTGGSVTYGTGLVGDFSKNYPFEFAWCHGTNNSANIGVNFEGATLSMAGAENGVWDDCAGVTTKVTGGKITCNSQYPAMYTKNFEMSGGELILNGTGNGASAVYVLNGTFKMTGGTITQKGSGYGVFLEGGTTSFEMTGGTIQSDKNQAILGCLAQNANFNVSGGKISGGDYGVRIYNNAGGNVNVSGTAEISGTTAGIYMQKDQSNQSVKVTGGTVTGAMGVYAGGGSVEVSGGTVTGSGDNGLVADGSATVKVTSGGTVAGKTNVIKLNSATAKVTESVSGTLNGTYDYYLTQGASVKIGDATYTATNGNLQLKKTSDAAVSVTGLGTDGILTISNSGSSAITVTNTEKTSDNTVTVNGVTSGSNPVTGTIGATSVDGLTTAANCVVTINSNGTMTLSTGESTSFTNRTSISNFGSISNGVLTLAGDISSSAQSSGGIKSLVVINNYGSKVIVRDKSNADIFSLGENAGFGVKLTDSSTAQLVSTASGNAVLSTVPTSGAFTFLKKDLALSINNEISPFKITSTQYTVTAPISFSSDGVNLGWNTLKLENVPSNQKFTASPFGGAIFPSGNVSVNGTSFTLNTETAIVYSNSQDGYIVGGTPAGSGVNGGTGILITDTDGAALTGHTITVDSSNKISVTNIPASGAKFLNPPTQWRTNLEGTTFETASGNVNGTFDFAGTAYVINSTSTSNLKFTLKSDGDVFTCYPSKIENVEGTVKGNFANGGTAFNNSSNSVKVETDAEVTLTVGASGVTKIEGVSAGANVSAVDGTTTTEVVTDSAAGTFTVLKADYKTGTANSLTIIPDSTNSTSKLKAGTVVLTAPETESADATDADTVDTSFVTGSAEGQKTLTATSGEITAIYVNGALTEVSGLDADETFTLDDVNYKVTSAGGLMKYTTKDGTEEAITGLHVASVGGKVTAAQLAGADATFWQETYVVTDQIIEVKSDTITIDGAAKSGYLVDEDDPTKIYGTLTKNTDNTYTLTAASKTTGADAKGITITGATVSVAKDFANVEITAGTDKKFTVTSAADAFTVNATDSDITIKQGTIESTAFASLKLNGVASGITGTGKVTITTANSAITSVSGISETTTFTNDLSNGVSVDGSVIKVSGDESVQVIGNSAGTSVSGLSGISNGANLESVGTATTATTDFTANEESAITIGSAYTVTDSDGVVNFGLSGTKVTAVNGLSGTVTGDLTNVHTLNASSANITVAGDTSISAAISGTETVFSGVGNSSGVTLSGDALKGAKINTDATGDLTIGKATYKIAGDSTVTFAMDSNSATVVTSITNFDAAGTISGALNGVKFNTASASVAVGKDTDFAVVNDGSTLYLANISDGAVVANSGEMNKVVTDTEGKYTIGTAADKFTISGDSSVEFALKENAVTGINSIDGSAVLTASNKEISLNDTAVTLGAENNYTVSFADGKIGTVSGASLVSGVENALIVETTAAQIGTTAVNITGDRNGYGISVLSDDAIGEISSLTGGATVTGLADATLKTDSEGNFTFGTTGYNVGGDSAVTFLTDSNGSLSAVNDLTGTVKTTDNAISINGDEVSISGLSDSTTLTYTADALGIAAITGLTNNATVTGAENAALNLVGTTSTSVATSLTANGKTFELLNDDDGVTITGGNVISGLKAGASLKADAGSYIINNEAVTVEAGQVVYGTEEGTADVYSESATKPVDDEVAGDSEKLAEAVGIDTSSYEKASDELQDAVNKGTASASDLNGNMSLTVTNSETEGAQNLDLTETTGIKNVTLKDGDQEITFNNENGNVAQIDSNSTGEKTINLGSGEATAIIAKGTKANATVNFGTGAGRLVSGANVLANLAMAIMATFRAVSGALMTVTNYDARNTKSGIDSSFSNISAAVRSGKLTMSNGVVNTGEGSYALNSGTTSGDIVEDVAADAGDSEGSTVFNIYNSKGKMQRIGFTHNDGGTIDLSEQKAAVILQGNSTGNKKNESTLLGGSGNDTIFAGSSDIINAGTGTNKIILNSVGETGAVLQMSENGRNNVDGFNYGFGESNDAISVDTTKAKITVDDSGNVVIKNGRAKTTLTSAAADAEENNFAEILIVDGADTLKTAVAKEGNVIAVSSDADNFANNYIGDGSGLSFSSYESEVNLNLSETTATFGGEEVQVSGINNVTLGEADATVFGSDAKETITAGSGNETIWAGAGKDTLNGFSGNADDKSGSITFGFMAGDGKDVINNFGYLTTENAQTADRVWTTGQFEATLSGNDVKLTFNGNKKDSLRITGAKGQNIQLSENGNLESVTTVLQVSDTLLSYDGLATKYVATGSNVAVVATSDTATANIWLEDKYSNLSNNTTYTGKITAVNAAAVEGSATLVGNSYDNLITGAQGSSSMWGGDSTSNDTLIGGTEGNMFFYGVTGGNEGNDTITGITEDDTVNLFGIQLADISDFDITNSTIALKFSAGGSLTMGNNGQTFMLANDQNQRYTYDKENSQWTKA